MSAAHPRAEQAEQGVVIDHDTKVRGPVFWGAVLAVGAAGMALGSAITKQDVSAGDIEGVKVQVAAKAEVADLKALATEVATKATITELKNLASNVVAKDLFEARLDDVQRQLDSFMAAQQRLTTDLADARREAADRANRLEDLFHELAKRP